MIMGYNNKNQRKRSKRELRGTHEFDPKGTEKRWFVSYNCDYVDRGGQAVPCLDFCKRKKKNVGQKKKQKSASER